MTNFLHTPSIAAWSPYASSKGFLALGQSSPVTTDSSLSPGSQLSIGSLACEGSANNISTWFVSYNLITVSRHSRQRSLRCIFPLYWMGTHG